MSLLMGNIYRTQDFNLACYLYSSGLLYKRIEGGEGNNERCSFIFEVPETINLPMLLQQRDSVDTEMIRTILFKSKLLKTELKKYFALNSLLN